MNIFLSRKGFDCSAGGCANPIIDLGGGNKQFLSLPIPEEIQPEELNDQKRNFRGRRYSELSFKYGEQEYSFSKLVEDLSGIKREYCHLDPDINKSVWNELPPKWQPGFGPLKRAYTQFYKDCVHAGDIILFFGWFREITLFSNKFIFKKDCPDVHAIYGYMQIGREVRDTDKDELYWHPHADEKDNCIFTPTDNLIVNGKRTDYAGYGLFKCSEDTILTKEKCPRSFWKNSNFIDDSICEKTYTDQYGEFFVKRGWKQWQEYRYDNICTIKNIITWLEEILKKNN